MTRSPQILLIEDDSDLADAIVEVLQTEGYRVIHAPDGRAALRMLSDGRVPQMILLDLMMPNMDGWEFRSEQLRDPRLAKIPVVVLSASGDGARPISAKLMLRKPVTLETLVAAVRKFVQPS
ncbi:MAG TPA: response regulator [Candidatus Binataceae bacterium]|nr:response regulator [Candidatus Binataceae bacterium]